MHCCCKFILHCAEHLVCVGRVHVVQDSTMKNVISREHVTAFSAIELLCKQSHCLASWSVKRDLLATCTLFYTVIRLAMANVLWICLVAQVITMEVRCMLKGNFISTYCEIHLTCAPWALKLWPSHKWKQR